MNKAALLLVLLASCGKGKVHWCDFFTAGLCVSSVNIVEPLEIEQTVEALEYFTQEYYPKVSNLTQKFEKHNISVYLTDRNLVKDCSNIYDEVEMCDNIAGVNIGGSKIYVEYFGGCLAFSSLAHELLHSIDTYYLDGPHGHSTPYFFTRKYKKDAIEYKTYYHLLRVLKSCEWLGLKY